MENKSCLSRIKAEYKNLTNKEKQLADYILDSCPEVASMSTAELAEKSEVVKSVIIRFCQTLGFKGYAEFKLTLSKELAVNEKFNFIPYISAEDTPEQIMDKIFAANVKTLYDTSHRLDRSTFQNAVEILSQAENIYIYGIGTSAGIVCDFQYRLMQLGFKAFCFTDVANMKVSTLNITDRDAAVGISNSGRTIATIEALTLAREKGAKTVCITSYPNSQIIKAADCPLIIISDEIQYPIEAISARIAHISVLDSITVALSAAEYEKTIERAAKTRDLIDTVRY